jgi:hypothetical protein
MADFIENGPAAVAGALEATEWPSKSRRAG